MVFRWARAETDAAMCVSSCASSSLIGRGHGREILPRHTRRRKQMAVAVAEVTDPDKHVVLTSFDRVHD